MRREGYELEVSRPQVIIKEIDGQKCEPYEDLSVEVPNDYVGDVMTSLGSRDAELIDKLANPLLMLFNTSKKEVLCSSILANKFMKV